MISRICAVGLACVGYGVGYDARWALGQARVIERVVVFIVDWACDITKESGWRNHYNLTGTIRILGTLVCTYICQSGN